MVSPMFQKHSCRTSGRERLVYCWRLEQVVKIAGLKKENWCLAINEISVSNPSEIYLKQMNQHAQQNDKT